MKKIRPKPLELGLLEALDRVAPLKPGIGKASEHSLPNFHNNVYVRLLAAKPKMDAITRRIYPSTLLTKIGFTPPDNDIGVMSSLKPFHGPRLWASSSPDVTSVPSEVKGRLVGKQPFLVKVKTEPKYGARSVLLEDLKWTLHMYKRYEPGADRPIVCYIESQTPPILSTEYTAAPVFNINTVPELMELNLPERIHNGKFGLYLAGCVFKYLYIYKSDK